MVASPARSPWTVSRPTSTVISTGGGPPQIFQAAWGVKVFSITGLTSEPWTTSTRTFSTRCGSSIRICIGVLRPIPGRVGLTVTRGEAPV